MASESARAVLEQSWTGLVSEGLECALMGGIALAMWNYPRATRDVDILVGLDRGRVEWLVRQLSKRGFRPRHTPPLRVLETHCFLQMLFTPPGEFYDVTLDLLLAESELQISALHRRLERRVPGIHEPVAVIQCEDLLLFKLVAGRMIDLADAAMLLRENRAGLDLQYLGEWVSRLDLSKAIRQIWSEAFPGEEIPI